MKKRVRRLLTVGGVVCLLLANSIVALAAGWEQSGDGWYYRGNSGELLKNNWVYDGGNNYYLGGDGRMLTGEHMIVYRTCRFDEGGALVEEGAPVDVTGLDLAKLQKAQRAVQDYWPGIVAGYDMVNEERVKNGANPTMLNYDLCVAAAYRCQQMEDVVNQGGGLFYSGPDAGGEWLWNTVPRALLNDASYIGTENKSRVTGRSIQHTDHGVKNLTWLLKDQFTSPSHYAQVIGQEYGQIGLAVWYDADQISYHIAEEIKVGE